MEAEGAAVIWGRSIANHNMWYKWMVSVVGDSKAFSSVEDTYENCKGEKLDCVGHVQKRMGKHLLNLKSRSSGKLLDGKSVRTGATNRKQNKGFAKKIWACNSSEHNFQT